MMNTRLRRIIQIDESGKHGKKQNNRIMGHDFFLAFGLLFLGAADVMADEVADGGGSVSGASGDAAGSEAGDAEKESDASTSDPEQGSPSGSDAASPEEKIASSDSDRFASADLESAASSPSRRAPSGGDADAVAMIGATGYPHLAGGDRCGCRWRCRRPACRQGRIRHGQEAHRLGFGRSRSFGDGWKRKSRHRSD